jgi:tetratricopeptide (TPR) repeat protein
VLDSLPRTIQQVQQQSARARYQRGLELISDGDAPGAEKEFKAALAEDPGDSSYVRELARVYIAAKRYEDAIQVIRDYTKLCGVTPLGYALEGELLFQQRLYDAAYEAIRKSLDIYDSDPRMHHLLGLIYMLKGQNPAAVIELNKASELDPDQAQTRFYYGRALYSVARYMEARDQFLACIKIEPQYRKAFENLGLCYEAAGDYTQAAQAYQRAIELEKGRKGPKFGEPFGFYGAMLTKLRQPEKAVDLLREGVALCPQSFVVNFQMGKALLTLDRLNEAEHYLLTAEHLAPAYAQTYYLMGKVHQKQHRAKEAAQDFEEFKQLSEGARNDGYPITDR